MPDTQLLVCGIHEESIVDGPGIRYVIFTQGCYHNCKGCHNPQSHAFDAGYYKSIFDIEKEILLNPLIAGVTFSGGEPIIHADTLYTLAKNLKKHGKHICIFTGHILEDLIKMSNLGNGVEKLLTQVDMVIDGQYKEELRDLTLLYRGSSNQNIWIKENNKWVKNN